MRIFPEKVPTNSLPRESKVIVVGPLFALMANSATFDVSAKRLKSNPAAIVTGRICAPVRVGKPIEARRIKDNVRAIDTIAVLDFKKLPPG
jgi:hypothetical protein